MSLRLSGEAVDDRLGLETHGQVSRWENQRREMTAADLVDFANAIGLDVRLVPFEADDGE